MSLDPQQVTIVGLLFAIGAAGMRKVWVWGWTLADKEDQLKAMTVDRDFWRDTALRAIGHTDKAIDVVAKDRQ